MMAIAQHHTLDSNLFGGMNDVDGSDTHAAHPILAPLAWATCLGSGAAFWGGLVYYLF